ncbi:MAG: T9SS type A sorting domain-containing protein [Bacteroidales bacterium]|nr:T9SS type A sorting domain-containing protein [Bacteroidales bacterium]
MDDINSIKNKINLNQGTNSEEILLNELPNGIYILCLEKDGSFYNKKFVIDR